MDAQTNFRCAEMEIGKYPTLSSVLSIITIYRFAFSCHVHLDFSFRIFRFVFYSLLLKYQAWKDRPDRQILYCWFESLTATRGRMIVHFLSMQLNAIKLLLPQTSPYAGYTLSVKLDFVVLPEKLSWWVEERLRNRWKTARIKTAQTSSRSLNRTTKHDIFVHWKLFKNDRKQNKCNMIKG